MIKNKLGKEEIESIKKKIAIKEIDEDVLEKHNWINIKELFVKVTRTVKEELVLFRYSADFLSGIEDDKIKKLLEEISEIKNKVNELLLSAEERLEIFGRELLMKNRDDVNYLTGLVFGNFIATSKKSGKTSGILERIKTLRDKK